MILYHGTNQEIHRIDLTKCRPYKDFGRGFYTTHFQDQAIQMAKRVSQIYGGHPIICRFEVNETEINQLRVLKFAVPCDTWAQFVMNNRKRVLTSPGGKPTPFSHSYDVVIGPVANDDLALLFRQFEFGFLTSKALIKEMTFKKLTIQYSFHTERAIQLLKNCGVEYV